MTIDRSTESQVSQQSFPMSTASPTQHFAGPVSFGGIQHRISPSGGSVRGGDDSKATEISGGSFPGRDLGGRIVGGGGQGRGSEGGPKSGQDLGFNRDDGSGSRDDENGPGVEEATGSRNRIETERQGEPGEGGELQRHVEALNLETEGKRVVDDAAALSLETEGKRVVDDDAAAGNHRGGDAPSRDGASADSDFQKREEGEDGGEGEKGGGEEKRGRGRREGR